MNALHQFAPFPGFWLGRSRLENWLRSAMPSRAENTKEARAKSSIATVEEVIADLTDLNQQTEQDFLSVAGQMTELLNEVRQISSEMTALTDSMSGCHSDHTAGSLTSALEQAQEMQMRAEEANHALASIQDAAGQLSKTSSQLERTDSGFQTLATLIRIETARLGAAGADFGNLADEVSALARNIQARVDCSVETAGKLSRWIAMTIEGAAAAGRRNAKGLPSVIAEITGTLDAIRNGQQRAGAASVRLDEQFTEVSRSIQDLALSIQFQDITRQRVEHIIENLAQICSESRRGSHKSDGLAAGSSAVLKLQAAQLAEAGTTFGRSVKQVQQSLDSIAARVAQIASECQVLAGNFESEQTSFFIEVERGCSVVLDAIGICIEAEQRLHGDAGDLSGGIGQVRGIVEGLNDIDCQIKRLALNAIIRAAQLGEMGNPLGLLAGAMQNLAFESGRRSDAAAGLLSSMQAGARMLQRGRTVTSGRDTLMQDLKSAIASVHSSTEGSFLRIHIVQELGSQLSERLSATRQGFNPGVVFSDAVARALKALAEVAGDFEPGALQDTGRLEDLGHRYTMQSERDVHEMISMTANSLASSSDPAPASEQQESSEGSFELF